MREEREELERIWLSIHCPVGWSHNLTVADVLPLAGLVSYHGGSISPAPAPASLHLPGPCPQPRRARYRHNNISRTQTPGPGHLAPGVILCEKYFSQKYENQPVTFNCNIPPSQLTWAFHWLDVTLGQRHMLSIHTGVMPTMIISLPRTQHNSADN